MDKRQIELIRYSLNLADDAAADGASAWNAFNEVLTEIEQLRAEIERMRALLVTIEENERLRANIYIDKTPAGTDEPVLTTDAIAYLETRRLTMLWEELGQLRWEGADEGWNKAIDAVRDRINEECNRALAWKTRADKSHDEVRHLLHKLQQVNPSGSDEGGAR